MVVVLSGNLCTTYSDSDDSDSDDGSDDDDDEATTAYKLLPVIKKQ